MSKGFAITNKKGFHIGFDNGYTVSVQFGAGNYCDNYNEEFGKSPPPSSDAEVAVFSDEGWYHPKCVPTSGDDVYPRMSPADVAKIISEVSAL